MNVQEAKRRVRLQEWAKQINDCKQSGSTVAQWCAENGIHKKTYYNRMKRVREELLEAMGSDNASQLQMAAGTYGTSIVLPDRKEMQAQIKMPKPVFAALPMPQSKSASVTVWMGGCAVDIQSGADDAIVEQVLKVVSRL